MLDLLVLIFLLILVLLVFGTAAYAGLQAAPWVPVFKKDIERIIKLVDIQEGDVVYDLGCGDGRVLVALANNSRARLLVGYEISFIPYLWSKLRFLFLGLGSRAEVRYANFLRRDLGQADVIFCFLTPMAMRRLEPKFASELRRGTRIVSYSFSLPRWQPVTVDRADEKSIPIFKYVVDPVRKF